MSRGGQRFSDKCNKVFLLRMKKEGGRVQKCLTLRDVIYGRPLRIFWNLSLFTFMIFPFVQAVSVLIVFFQLGAFYHNINIGHKKTMWLSLILFTL
jgi:hypothetical protein